MHRGGLKGLLTRCNGTAFDLHWLRCPGLARVNCSTRMYSYTGWSMVTRWRQLLFRLRPVLYLCRATVKRFWRVCVHFDEYCSLLNSSYLHRLTIVVGWKLWENSCINDWENRISFLPSLGLRLASLLFWKQCVIFRSCWTFECWTFFLVRWASPLIISGFSANVNRLTVRYHQ